MARLKGLMLVPSQITLLVAHIINLTARVELEKTGGISAYDPSDDEKTPSDVSSRIVNLFLQEGQERAKRAALMGNPEWATKRLLEGANVLRILALNEDFKLSIEAMLAS